MFDDENLHKSIQFEVRYYILVHLSEYIDLWRFFKRSKWIEINQVTIYSGIVYLSGEYYTMDRACFLTLPILLRQDRYSHSQVLLQQPTNFEDKTVTFEIENKFNSIQIYFRSQSINFPAGSFLGQNASTSTCIKKIT